MKPPPLNQIERHQQLRAAETKALQLFAEVETRQLVRAGVPESVLNAQVYALASELFGVNFRTKNCSVKIWKTTSILKTVQECEIRTRAATHATGFSKFTLSTDRGRLVGFSSNCLTLINRTDTSRQYG
jgi:hypothetical protein